MFYFVFIVYFMLDMEQITINPIFTGKESPPEYHPTHYAAFTACVLCCYYFFHNHIH